MAQYDVHSRPRPTSARSCRSAERLPCQLHQTQAPPPGPVKRPQFSRGLAAMETLAISFCAPLGDHQNLIAIGPFDAIPTDSGRKPRASRYRGRFESGLRSERLDVESDLSDAPVTRAAPRFRPREFRQLSGLATFAEAAARVKPSEVFRCPSRACR